MKSMHLAVLDRVQRAVARRRLPLLAADLVLVALRDAVALQGGDAGHQLGVGGVVGEGGQAGLVGPAGHGAHDQRGHLVPQGAVASGQKRGGAGVLVAAVDDAARGELGDGVGGGVAGGHVAEGRAGRRRPAVTVVRLGQGQGERVGPGVDRRAVACRWPTGARSPASRGRAGRAAGVAVRVAWLPPRCTVTVPWSAGAAAPSAAAAPGSARPGAATGRRARGARRRARRARGARRRARRARGARRRARRARGARRGLGGGGAAKVATTRWSAPMVMGSGRVPAGRAVHRPADEVLPLVGAAVTLAAAPSR